MLDACSDAGQPVRIRYLVVRDLPGTGTPEELMEAVGMSASQMTQAAREAIGG